MRLYFPTGIVRTERPDFSDLTTSTQVAARWEEAGTVLVMEFDPEPSPAEQVLIRRRLMTRDAAHEAWVGALRAEVDAMVADTPSARAIRLMALESLRGIDQP